MGLGDLDEVEWAGRANKFRPPLRAIAWRIVARLEATSRRFATVS
jgi:hypothetical protein